MALIVRPFGFALVARVGVAEDSLKSFQKVLKHFSTRRTTNGQIAGGGSRPLTNALCEQLALEPCDLNVDHTEDIQLAAPCESTMLRSLRK